MASNFRISIHRSSDYLHMKLLGDFDGTSAWQLINMLKANAGGVYKIIIHTNSLKKICPFGRDTFRQNLLELKSIPAHILFTGENASQIAPDKKLCI